MTQSFERVWLELQAGKHGRSATAFAVFLHALSTSFGRLFFRSRHPKPCYGEQEARIDAIVAGLDAGPALHARLRPSARRFRAMAAAYQFNDAADGFFGVCIRDAGRLEARTNLDALPAASAGVEHFFDIFTQSCLERDVVHPLHDQLPVS